MNNLTIGKLKELIKRYDDNDIVSFQITDSFNCYGEKVELVTGQSYGKDGNDITDEWAGSRTGKFVTIALSLEDKEDKRAKITYRVQPCVFPPDTHKVSGESKLKIYPIQFSKDNLIGRAL